jgi:uncharacterized protein (TIGR02246 family)
MSGADSLDVDRAAIVRVTAELLGAVNASDVDRCLAVWSVDGVMMPPHHPSVHGHKALAEYFHRLFSRSRFRFQFTSPDIQITGDTALEIVTYTAVISPIGGASSIEDAGKGLHVYRRQSNGTWKLALDIWNSDAPGPAANE